MLTCTRVRYWLWLKCHRPILPTQFPNFRFFLYALDVHSCVIFCFCRGQRTPLNTRIVLTFCVLGFSGLVWNVPWLFWCLEVVLGIWLLLFYCNGIQDVCKPSSFYSRSCLHQSSLCRFLSACYSCLYVHICSLDGVSGVVFLPLHCFHFTKITKQSVIVTSGCFFRHICAVQKSWIYERLEV